MLVIHFTTNLNIKLKETWIGPTSLIFLKMRYDVQWSKNDHYAKGLKLTFEKKKSPFIWISVQTGLSILGKQQFNQIIALVFCQPVVGGFAHFVLKS